MWDSEVILKVEDQIAVLLKRNLSLVFIAYLNLKVILSVFCWSLVCIEASVKNGSKVDAILCRPRMIEVAVLAQISRCQNGLIDAPARFHTKKLPSDAIHLDNVRIYLCVNGALCILVNCNCVEWVFLFFLYIWYLFFVFPQNKLNFESRMKLTRTWLEIL